MSRDRLGDLRQTDRREPYLYRSNSGDISASGRQPSDIELGRLSNHSVPSRTGSSSSHHTAADSDEFNSQCDFIQRTIDRINSSLKTIEKLHSRALTAVSPEETSKLTRQVDQAQDETNRFIEDARGRLQQISAQTKSSNGRDVRVKKAKQAALAKSLMKVAENYQKIQAKYAKEYKKRMVREIRIAKPNASEKEIERMIESRGPIFAQELVSSKVGEQRRILEEVQGRQKELQRIEESINDLVNLFSEMQTLIEAQQEFIDTIDVNVENTQTHVTEGSKEVSKAIEYRISSRKKWWWVLGLSLVLLIILALVLYFYWIKPTFVDKPPPKMLFAKQPSESTIAMDGSQTLALQAQVSEYRKLARVRCAWIVGLVLIIITLLTLLTYFEIAKPLIDKQK